MAKRKTKTGDTKLAVGYIRVSTTEQHLGPEAQREDLERWAERAGVQLVAVFEDIGVSGGAPVEKRPGLLSALDALEVHGAGLLVASKRDRLARDVMVTALLERLAERAGARAFAIDDDHEAEAGDPNAFIMRGFKDLMAQYERLLIRSRTRAALAVKKRRGERVGELPIGAALAEDRLHLVENPEEAAAVVRVGELRLAGVSLRGIAQTLDGEGFKPRGKRWHRTTVERIVARLAVGT
jgi:DNA invertase Pin-like site-specific DNA recombinase